MTQENTPNKEQLKQAKSAYSQLVNDSIDLLVNQPVEAAKKIVQASIDTQTEMFSSLASASKYTPVADLSQSSSKVLQFYVSQLQQNKEASSKALNVFTEATLAWQKVAAEAQKSAIDAYSAWFARTTQTSAQ